MELRKVISFGNSSYVVSLPKAWIRKNRVKKGDFIKIEEKPTELVLTIWDKGERRKIKEISVSAENKDPKELEAEIISAYISNHDIITIIGLKQGNHDEVKKIIRGLVGMEVIEESATKMVAKDLLDIKEVPLDKIVRRVDTLIRAIYDDALLTGSFKDISERDDEVNRQVFLGYRVVRSAFDNPRLAKMFDISYINLMMIRKMLTQMEDFADQIKRISRLLSEVNPKKKKREDFEKLYKIIKDYYLKTMKAFYEKDKGTALKLSVETKKLFGECDQLLMRHKDSYCTKLVEYLKKMIDAMRAVLRCNIDYEE